MAHCSDDAVSEYGATDVLTGDTPTPSSAYLPPNPELSSVRVDSLPDNCSEYRNASAGMSPPTDRNVPRHSHGAASAVSSVPSPSVASAGRAASGGGNVQTLPRLELQEPTRDARIIEVQLPWLFWVQQNSQELEDIIDIMEYVGVTASILSRPYFTVAQRNNVVSM